MRTTSILTRASRWSAAIALPLLAIIATLTLGMSSAAAANYNGGGWVTQTNRTQADPSFDGNSCIWFSGTLQNVPGSETVTFTSGGGIDGPTGCNNQTLQAVPGSLTESQNIWWSENDTVCNYGPRIANGASSHTVSTSWTVTSPCGVEGGTYFWIQTTVYYLSAWSGQWVGGVGYGPEVYVS